MALPTAPAFHDGSRIVIDLDGASAHSSSSISSPPVSPPHVGLADTIRVAASPRFSSQDGVAAPRLASAQAPQPLAHAAPAPTAAAANTPAAPAPEKPKRQRRKKEVGPDGRPVEDEKPKKPRKPREPKEKPVASATSTNGATGSRKKPKIEPSSKDATPPVALAARQPTIDEMVAAIGAPAPALASTSTSNPPRPASVALPVNAGNLSVPFTNSSSARPASSGQKYDPVRGYDPVRAASMETSQAQAQAQAQAQSQAQTHARPSPSLMMAPAPQATTTTTHVNRASASPSIASLIDPPVITYASPPSFANTNNSHSHPASPRPGKSAPVASFVTAPRVEPPAQVSAQPVKQEEAMEIDSLPVEPKTAPQTLLAETKLASKSSSPVVTPKVARHVDSAPPKGTGSGLLSSSDLFGGPSTNGDASERRGVNIDIHIPLNPSGNNIINMAQEIAKKYGRDAINPRAAAHRERLMAVAAAAKKIEGAAGDDMSVELLSDDGDSNIEMGGVDEDRSGTGADSKPTTKRRRKMEEYDKEDDFIDDTELAWQEQAAVAKDGFFVYSGPLIPVGQDVRIESSAPTRGRGRGRGRGSRGGATTTHASLADKTKDASTPPTTGRGRGRGRGTGVPRKPRVSKAEKERVEAEKAEKAERERAASQLAVPAAAQNYTAPVFQQPPAGTVA